MYLKNLLFILISSFFIGVIISYYNRVDGTIIVYPKLKRKVIYLDDTNTKYYYMEQVQK